MADLETSFVADMKAATAIKALVGNRVYEFDADKLTKEPYIVVRPTSNPRMSWTQTLYGGIARISVYIEADTVASCRTIGDAILSRYRQFSGTLGTHTVEQVEVGNARVLFGPGTEFRYLVDLVVHYH